MIAWTHTHTQTGYVTCSVELCSWSSTLERLTCLRIASSSRKLTNTLKDVSSLMHCYAAVCVCVCVCVLIMDFDWPMVYTYGCVL